MNVPTAGRSKLTKVSLSSTTPNGTPPALCAVIVKCQDTVALRINTSTSFITDLILQLFSSGLGSIFAMCIPNRIAHYILELHEREVNCALHKRLHLKVQTNFYNHFIPKSRLLSGSIWLSVKLVLWKFRNKKVPRVVICRRFIIRQLSRSARDFLHD